jgi:hypothetical protein
MERLRAGDRPNILPHAIAAVARELLADLQPGDHALAVWLLERAIAGAAAELIPDDPDALETLYGLVAVVARFAHPEDALLIWRASQATAETRDGVDVEQTLRADPDAVMRTLRRMSAANGQQGQDAAMALAWIQQGIAEGAANDLSSYFAWSDERFGLYVTGAT